MLPVLEVVAERRRKKPKDEICWGGGFVAQLVGARIAIPRNLCVGN